MYLSAPQVACSSHSPAVREVAVFPWRQKTTAPLGIHGWPQQKQQGRFFLCFFPPRSSNRDLEAASEKTSVIHMA